MALDGGRQLSDAALVEIKRALRGLMEATGTTQLAIKDATGIDQGRISKITNEQVANARPTLVEVLAIEEACGAAPGFVLAAAGLISVEGAELGAAARRAGTRRDTGPSARSTEPRRSRRRR